MGTSLQVYPVASLPDIVPHSVPRVLFNRDPVHIAKKYKLSELAGQFGLSNSDQDDSSEDNSSEDGTTVGDESSSNSNSGGVGGGSSSSSSGQATKAKRNARERGDEEVVDTGFWFNLAENFRDVFVQGNCDDTVSEFVSLLGWEEEFEALTASKVTTEQENEDSGNGVSDATDALESLTL